MDNYDDKPTSACYGISGLLSLAQLRPVDDPASPDTAETSLTQHENTDNDATSTTMDTPTSTDEDEAALIAEAKQRRLEIFKSEYLCTSAAAAAAGTSVSGLTLPTSSTSPTPFHPKLPITAEYANMILGRPFKVSRCRTLQALKFSARVKCARYNNAAAATVSEDGVDDESRLEAPQAQAQGQDTENANSAWITTLSTTLATHRSAQRLQLLDLLGSVAPSPSPDPTTTAPAPAIDPPFAVFIGLNIRIGHSFYANANVRIHDHAPVLIGNQVRLGPNVSLLTEYHPLDPRERRRGDVLARPITIGDDVWIGAGATVLGGVVIGDGAVVGAGAVVVREVRAGECVVGVPARVVRRWGERVKGGGEGEGGVGVDKWDARKGKWDGVEDFESVGGGKWDGVEVFDLNS